MKNYEDEERPWWASELELAACSLTEFGNGERFVERCRGDYAYVPKHGWRAWTGQQWVSAETGRWSVYIKAQKTIEHMDTELEAMESAQEKPKKLTKTEKRLSRVHTIQDFEKWIKQSSRTAMVRSMLELAQPRLSKAHDEWDRAEGRINLKNGTLCFKALFDDDETDLNKVSPLFNPARREDYITKTAPVDFDPDAKAPLWEAHLSRCLPDPEVRAYFQRWMGYALTDHCREQKILIMIGEGANGKSTTLRVLQDLLGLYSASVPSYAFQKRTGIRAGAPTPDLIRLEAKRLVVASEPEDGLTLSEAVVKNFTGSDRVVGRDVHEKSKEFIPQLKLIMPCNRLPRIAGRGEAIWRRIQVLEWPIHIPERERDPSMQEKLKGEWPGIFNWMVEGLIAHSKQGLNPPPSVLEAVDRYRGTTNPVARWMEARLQTGLSDENRISLSDLHTDYERWCAGQGVTPQDIRDFGRALTKQGLPSQKRGGRAVRCGVAFRLSLSQMKPS